MAMETIDSARDQRSGARAHQQCPQLAFPLIRFVILWIQTFRGRSVTEIIHPYQPPQESEPAVAATSNSQEKAATQGGLAGAVGGVVGCIFGLYAGANFFIPFVMVGIISAVAFKVAPRKSMPMLVPFAIQFAHGCWIFLGLLLLRQFDLNLFDVVLLLGGALWLILRPSIWPVIVLCLYQLPVLLINVSRLADAEFGDLVHRALAVHVLLRVIAVATMVIGIYKLRSSSRDASLT